MCSCCTLSIVFVCTVFFCIVFLGIVFFRIVFLDIVLFRVVLFTVRTCLSWPGVFHAAPTHPHHTNCSKRITRCVLKINKMGWLQVYYLQISFICLKLETIHQQKIKHLKSIIANCSYAFPYPVSFFIASSTAQVRSC